MVSPLRAIVLPLLRANWWLVARFLLISLAAALASVAVILLIRSLLTGARASFWLEACLLALAYLVANFLHYRGQVLLQHLTNGTERRLFTGLMQHVLRQPARFFERSSSGDLLHALRQDVTGVRTLCRSICQIALDGLLALGFVAVAVYLSPLISLVACAALSITSLPILRATRRLHAKSHAIRRRSRTLFDLLLEVLRNVRIIKVYRAERRQAELAAGEAEGFFAEHMGMARLQAGAQALQQSLAGLSLVVVIVAGASFVTGGGLTWPTLLALVVAIRSLHAPVQDLYANWLGIQTHRAAVQRIAELIEEAPAPRDDPRPPPPPGTPRRIEFQGVSLRVPGKTILDDISFAASAGETVAIVGPSGAGKTSLLDLLAGLYPPTSGRILFDGRDVAELRAADVYDCVAMVTQEPFLFATSVRENVRIGRPDATDAEIEAAARAAAVHGTILELQDGYGTRVGEGGVKLSAGQAQRINIARAVVKRARLLLLDEPTANLDARTEAAVFRGIAAAGGAERLTFVAAHRPAAIEDADRVLVLAEGRLVVPQT